MGGFRKVDVYDKLYDYDDLKIAVSVSEYLNEQEEPYDYEDIANLTIKIRRNWECDRKNFELSKEEFAYIQSYAWRYMKEHFGG